MEAVAVVGIKATSWSVWTEIEEVVAVAEEDEGTVNGWFCGSCSL